MARLTWTGDLGFEFRLMSLSNLQYGEPTTKASGTFIVTSGSYQDVFKGYGFSYDGLGVPTGGTVTSYAHYEFSQCVALVEGVKISANALVNAATTYSLVDDKAIYKAALAGHDRIIGGWGDDKLEAFGGNDKIIGGRGSDKLYGGSGSDIFIYRSTQDTPMELWFDDTVDDSEQDIIFDFSRVQKDKIHLTSIDADTTMVANQAFTFIGTQAFHNETGELRYEKIGRNTFVRADVDGDGFADFSIKLKGLHNLATGDFYL
jgi:Ca2+-binding RTX toxin-like protein